MTEEEKDILQDKVLREEANYFESNQHDELLSSDTEYQDSFFLKEGISRALAKEFIEKALETPVIPIEGDGKDGVKIAASVPAASHSPSSKNNMGWYAIAATLVIVLASTFFLSDFRTANEFAQAEIDNIPKSSEVLFGSAPVARGGFDWRRAFDEGNYNSVIQNLDESDNETKLALGISKLLCLNECEKDSDDFGQNELGWILKNDLPEGVSRSQVLWYNSLALYKAGKCDEAIAVLNDIIKMESEWHGKAKKYKRKLEKDCQKAELRTIEAVRGNIFSADGSLLATSKPIYEVRWDAAVPSLKTDTFNKYVDDLARQLSRLFGDKSATAYKRELTQARNNKSQYHLIKRKVDYKKLKQLRSFEIFNRGRYGGGLIINQKNFRSKPFKQLAAITIGYDRPDDRVGLEVLTLRNSLE